MILLQDVDPRLIDPNGALLGIFFQNGPVSSWLENQEKKGDSYVMTYNDYDGEEGNARKGEKKTLEVDVVIGADGANSRVAKDIEAGDYEYAIAFQERMRIPEQKMEYYKDRAEMYVGDSLVTGDFHQFYPFGLYDISIVHFYGKMIFVEWEKNDEPHFNNLIY